jgi:hypothetical protein
MYLWDGRRRCVGDQSCLSKLVLLSLGGGEVFNGPPLREAYRSSIRLR